MYEISSDVFSQLHIDVARNATDDFNLFHDNKHWHKIKDNPFQGPITLGFQLESLIEGKLADFRRTADELDLIGSHQLNFSNYQFSFANVIKAGQFVEVEIKPSQFKDSPTPVLSNRIMVKSDGNLALLGYKKETSEPLFLNSPNFSDWGDLAAQADRSYIGGGYFLKRKFMTTSNAKNFLCGCLRDQTEYFDELQDKVIFPEMFPCALLSSALLEKAKKKGHDFEKNPMVYTSHKISIDRRQLSELKSNDALHILIKPADNSAEHDFGESSTTALDYECYGVVSQSALLFRAIISLAPLELILKSLG
ncbi:hypothetical protein NP590_15305 [Methylomonas sp. SURF-2]|uniref:Uncharacterized protein n=1 Tax=Methylomonas subterranea TaxID=2952225 RepID=A0ABT1TJ64_9GAMM|nr:hypothetical protein [Methylomonas sp. SURF-2]MCQ8105480.1 hypothetical protein [Methylomonas sp. SURF-2]